MVAVAHVEPHRVAVRDHVEDHGAKLLELVDVVAVRLRHALGRTIAVLVQLQPHHLGLDPAHERVAELLLDLMRNPLQVLARVRVEQLAGLGVVAVAVHASHPRVPRQALERVEVRDRGQLGLLGPEPDVVLLAIREQVGGGAVDELVAALGDPWEPARDHALAVDVAADRDLLEEDVLDPLALDLVRELRDPLCARRTPSAPRPASSAAARSAASREPAAPRSARAAAFAAITPPPFAWSRWPGPDELYPGIEQKGTFEHRRRRGRRRRHRAS